MNTRPKRWSRKGLRPTRFHMKMSSIAEQPPGRFEMVYVYVIQSESDHGLYIGMSGNLRRRLAEHQEGESQSTKGRGPWKLIYYEAYLEREDASGREVFLKSGSGRRFLDKQLRTHFSRYRRRRAT